MASSYGFLLDKLRIPHPTVQRYAVKAIFETLKAGPSQLRLHSQVGQQALSQCLTSESIVVIEEALSELCSMMEEGLLPLDKGLQHLQIALESAGTGCVTMIVRNVGFVCRLLLQQAEDHEECSKILKGFQSYELHPFVKAFESRGDCHLELVRQVAIMLAQDDLRKFYDYIHFLQPFLDSVLLNPSATRAHSIIARELHFTLASLALSNFRVGHSLLSLLIQYISHYSLQTAEEVDRTFIALREVVDALDIVVKQAFTQTKVNDFRQVIRNILELLVEVSHELKIHRFPSLPILDLLRRVIELHKIYMQDFGFLSWKMISLAHMLATTDLKEEQLLLLCLARSLFRKTDLNGRHVLNDGGLDFPSALLWVFPTVSVMPSSCNLVKETATGLLQDIEGLLETYWTQLDTDISLSTFELPTTSLNGQLAVAMHRLLHHLWSDKEAWITWNSLEFGEVWLPVSYFEDRRKIWLQRLSCHLEKLLQCNSKASSASHFDAYQNKGLASWLSMLFSSILIHPSIGATTIEVVAAIVKGEPIRGLSLLPVVLFYARAWMKHAGEDKSRFLFGLLKMLPSLSCHPMTSSIVAQTLRPMLDPKCNQVLQATAIRLLCKTWEVSDKVFPDLQVVLEQPHPLVNATEYEISLSKAASVCDVCKRDADRGAELVLSVQGCIESEDCSIRGIGLQSLSWLCENDVIDFYTAWAVISKKFPALPSDPQLAQRKWCYICCSWPSTHFWMVCSP